MSKADERRDISVEEYIESIDDEAIEDDSRVLSGIMHRISGKEPILYGIGTIGFGVYQYEYSSGRKSEAHTLAFYPRKGKITIYLMDGTDRYDGLLFKLGRHTKTDFCVYVKSLSDVNLQILTKLLEESYKNIEAQSKAGAVDKIL